MRGFEFVITDGELRGQRVRFPSERFVIGSSSECAVHFEASLVHARHAEVATDESGQCWVRDLTQAGLLWVNGEQTAQGQLLPGTFIRLGRVELEVRTTDEAARSPSGTLSTPGALAVARAQPTPSSLVPGSIIDGRYRVLDKLAAGGMGEVYKAEHTELGKVFALKLMLPELSHDPEFVARFKREAIASSRIGQQNIVDISDFGRTADGRFYFVMEFLDGVTLASLLQRSGAQAVERSVSISLQIARALAAAHALGIVHRDLKPENVMLLQRPGQADFVKVLDFGVAKVSHGQGAGGQTAVGVVVGTPQYMSPEQAKALPIDARTDIYSLALMMYELLTGRPTFVGETPSVLMVKQVTEAPAPMHPGPIASVPAELESLVSQMLLKDPDRRPQTMSQVVDALELILAQVKSNSATARPLARPLSSPSGGRARSPVPVVAGGLVLFAALGGVGWFGMRPGREPAPIIVPPPTAPATPPTADLQPVPASPAPQKINMTITSVPDNAEVYETDVLLGTTPLVISREAGGVATVTISLKDHQSETKKIGFVADSEVAITLDPIKKDEPKVRRPGGKRQSRPRGELEDPYRQ